MSYKLWNKEEEEKFFKESLKKTSPEKLFYKTNDGRYFAYWPKDYKGEKTTLQSRNAFIGEYTEEWVKNLLEPIAKKFNAYTLRGVVCEEIGLGKKSPADVAVVRTPKKYQSYKNILLLIEVKMSIVWNWEYDPETESLNCIGDYTTHRGNPSLLRSDTMLKAIGKSINIRISSLKSAKIPIIVIGNTPITRTYYDKVDRLKEAGIVQGFYSVNPCPTDTNNGSNIKSTFGKGFVRIDKFEELENIIETFLFEEREFFSAMLTRRKLGEIIKKANKEPTYEKKAESFFRLIRSSCNG